MTLFVLLIMIDKDAEADLIIERLKYTQQEIIQMAVEQAMYDEIEKENDQEILRQLQQEYDNERWYKENN